MITTRARARAEQHSQEGDGLRTPSENGWTGTSSRSGRTREVEPDRSRSRGRSPQPVTVTAAPKVRGTTRAVQERLDNACGGLGKRASRYGRLRLWRTWVRHSRKGNLPVQFCRLRRVILHDGSKVWRKGGTQKIDGYWALLRKEVARRGVTTANSETLRDMVFFHQFLNWQSADPYCRCQARKAFGSVGQDCVCQLLPSRKEAR